MSVAAGSPAAGVLEPGDQIVAVSGGPPPAQGLLDPAVVQEIGSNLPGARLALTVDRGGQTLTENVTLSSYANAARQHPSQAISASWYRRAGGDLARHRVTLAGRNKSLRHQLSSQRHPTFDGVLSPQRCFVGFSDR